MPFEIIQQFEPLQDQILRMFDEAFKYTKNIFVITNAEVYNFLFVLEDFDFYCSERMG